MHSNYKHLESATDPGKMRNRIEKQLHRLNRDSGSLRDFWVTRVFPRRNGRFAIQYELIFGNNHDGRGKRLYLCANLLGSQEKWPSYADPDNKDVIIFKDIRLVIPVFPFDPKIKYLPEIVRSLETRGPDRYFKDHIYPAAKSSAVSGYEILGYRLERRCVIRFSMKESADSSSGSGQIHLIAKVFRPGRAIDPFRNVERLRHHGFGQDATDGMTVPRLFHCDNDKGIIVMENAPGISLHNMLGNPSFDKACGLAAGFLKKLHSLKTPDVLSYSDANEMETIQSKTELCGDIFPAIREKLLTIFEKLSSEKENLNETVTTCVHGDFHDKQVLYSAERSTLLDCDDMKLADPASDYGNFMAHMILRRIQFPELAGNIEAGMKTFTRKYAYDDDDFKQRARWWIAATLVRLAVLYSLRPRWRNNVPDILQEAASSLNQRKAEYGGLNAVNFL